MVILQLRIEKLRGRENYRPWAMTVRNYLKMLGVWDVVEYANFEAPGYTEKERQAQFVILCSLNTNNYFDYLLDSKTIWKRLEDEYGPLSEDYRALRVYLRERRLERIHGRRSESPELQF